MGKEGPALAMGKEGPAFAIVYSNNMESSSLLDI